MYSPEYILCRQIAYYLRAQYPDCIFHYDYAGLYHTKAQAGLMKAIQGDRGYPDLVILEKRGTSGALFIELKPEGTRLYKKDGSPASPHIAEQLECLLRLKLKGYQASFGIGFENTKDIIDLYLKQ